MASSGTFTLLGNATRSHVFSEETKRCIVCDVDVERVEDGFADYECPHDDEKFALALAKYEARRSLGSLAINSDLLIRTLRHVWRCHAALIKVKILGAQAGNLRVRER